MSQRVFLAGASGAIGRRLIPLLRESGHQVTGMTRASSKVEAIRALGADPVVADVFDAADLARAVAAARPDVVVHQLTDLPPGLDPALMATARPRNARIRDEGTRNLVRAAIGAGARRLIAQSVIWMYAPGPEPHTECDPLDARTDGPLWATVAGLLSLERQTLESPPLQGVVLRYGQLYGPGTGAGAPAGPVPLHVDAAAHAARLAVDRAVSGIFNIAEPNTYATTDKAAAELGWRAAFRLADAG